MKKIIAIALYVLYATALILALSFGTEVSVAIADKINEITHRAELSDVSLDVDITQPLMAGKWHYIHYTPEGKFEGTAKLCFESLEPDKLLVTADGAVFSRGEKEADKFSAKMRIYSKYDPDFEKIVELKFEKVYPTDFKANYFVSSVGYNKPITYVGIPISVYSSIPKGQQYGVVEYEIIYDSEYFTYDEDTHELVPIKVTAPGEKKTASVRYANGSTATTLEFEIAPNPGVVEEFYEVRFDGVSADSFEMNVKDNAFITLHNSEGKLLITDYDLILGENDSGSLNRAGRLRYSKAGNKDITIVLPNGFSKTVNIKINNIITLPQIEGFVPNEEGKIVLNVNGSYTYKFAFDDEVTYTDVSYKYASANMSLSKTARSFTIIPNRTGVTDLRVIVDDGESRVEKFYQLEFVGELDMMGFIVRNAQLFVAKFMGHMALFAILAFFALYMLSQFERDGIIRRFIVFTLLGLPIAALTEIIQIFLPGRTAAINDVFVDMAGYFIGALVVMFLLLVARLIRKIRN